MNINNRKVTFVESIKLFFVNYADFKGRSSRSAYWWPWLASILFSTLLEFFSYEFGILWSLVILIPSLSLACRRLHDIGRSGWWQLIAFTIIGIIPLIYWYAKKGTEGENRFGLDVEAGK
jgi:uncharacterized membrane protein YhaH (DUF805 family)